MLFILSDGFCDFLCFTWLSHLSHSQASSHYPCSTQHQSHHSSSKALVTFFLLYRLRPTFFGSTIPHLHLKLVLITSPIPPHSFFPTFYYEKMSHIQRSWKNYTVKTHILNTQILQLTFHYICFIAYLFL